MGLFSKKPKHPPADIPSEPDEITDTFPRLESPRQETAPAPQPERAQSAKKSKKYSVDPVDFLALRSELFDLKARLEASEQAKALVETRLAALDATTTAMASDRHGGDDVLTQLAELQAQLGLVAESAVAANATAENAAAKAEAAATVASNVVSTPSLAPPPTPDLDLLARLDALDTQVNDLNVAGVSAGGGATDPTNFARHEELAAKVDAGTAPDPGLLARVDQLSSRLDGAPDESRLVALESRLGELAAKADEPGQPVVQVATGPDPETLARIDQLAERVGAIDSFGSQLSQLNARVTAQAEFGAQLSSLRDRISELSNDTEDRRAAAFAATGEADLRDRVNAISDRLAGNDGFAAQIAQLAERVAANDSTTRQATEQVAAIEQRLSAVSTELANQISELGRDIDALAEHTGEPAPAVVSDEVVDHLKTAQVKLAFEQARYEIAFRQDLATLADQVRRNPRS